MKLAELIGVHHTTVGRWESDEDYRPAEQRYPMLAECLEVSLQELYEVLGEPRYRAHGYEGGRTTPANLSRPPGKVYRTPALRARLAQLEGNDRE